jgi:hypothetical protein
MGGALARIMAFYPLENPSDRKTIIATLMSLAGWIGAGGDLFPVKAGSKRRIGDFDGELIGVELFGVELFADPFDLFGTFPMSRIGQDFEQVLIAPRAAAILQGTVARTGNAGRIGSRRGPAEFSRSRPCAPSCRRDCKYKRSGQCRILSGQSGSSDSHRRRRRRCADGGAAL